MAKKNRKSGRRRPNAKSPWRRRIKRALLVALIALPLLLGGLWIAVHRYPWLGAALADGLRSVIGTEAVSRLEDFVYGLDDRWKRFWRKGEQPKAYWDVPDTASPSAATGGARAAGGGAPSAATGGGGEEPAARPLAPFAPANVGPMFKMLAAKGDGVWVAVADPVRPSAPTVLYKTLIHPDRERPWAELFVIAVDLRQVELHVVAGRYEPQGLEQEAHGVERPAVIPTEHHAALVAGFNGGFKATHGRWGMRAAGITFIRPRKHGCTIARYTDGSLGIDPWYDIDSREGEMTWWRQTPPCMYRQSKRHGSLWDPEAKGWGAALEGGTVIRRSAIGLNEARDTLYVSVSNDTNARAIADGMFHLGAIDVAQLDVNWSYPKIVMFPQGEAGLRETTSLFRGFNVEVDEYLRDPSPRDFFYLTRRSDP